MAVAPLTKEFEERVASDPLLEPYAEHLRRRLLKVAETEAALTAGGGALMKLH